MIALVLSLCSSFVMSLVRDCVMSVRLSFFSMACSSSVCSLCRYVCGFVHSSYMSVCISSFRNFVSSCCRSVFL